MNSSVPNDLPRVQDYVSAEVANLPYWDASLPVAERVRDLLSRLTIDEKAGLLFHDMAPTGPNGELIGPDNFMGMPATEGLIKDKRITHFNVLGSPSSAGELARWVNNLQKAALSTGHGIPITVSTDPRHAFTENQGTSFLAGCFSQWPESLGLAAIGDVKLIKEFANIARQEYLATGIRAALHPQIDLATEPRWARAGGTFGESAKLSGEIVEAYVRGFQTNEFGTQSVSTMTKHFPGGGPQKDGEDPHFHYGKEQVYPAGQFDYHLEPFKNAIAAGTRQMMPYYGQPIGTKYEEVAFGFNKGVLTDLLKDELGFEGVVCTDWGLITDANIMGQEMPARAWGVEHLTPLERVEKALNAGVDQFGGEVRTDLVLELVAAGRISEDRIDDSARKLLAEKFILGLFDQPFVSESEAERIVGQTDFVAAGFEAQQRSVVRLTNADPAGAKANAALPLKSGLKIYAEGMTSEAVASLGIRVDALDQADVAILRLKSPFEPRPGGFEALFPAGSLEFSAEALDHIAEVCNSVPTIIDVSLNRASVLTPLVDLAATLVVSFGASSAALAEVLNDPSKAQGRLPFDLPRSMAAVVASPEDAPFATENPLFKFGFGL